MEVFVPMDEALTRALQRIEQSVSLEEQDWEALTAGSDLISVGLAADEARRRHHGDRVTFVQVVEVPLDNAEASEPIPEQAGEVRLVGRPETVSQTIKAVKALADWAGVVPVTGFALEDLLDLCGNKSEKLERLLQQLRQAGLAMVSRVAFDALGKPEPILAALRAGGMDVASLCVDSPSGATFREALLEVASWKRVGTVFRSLAPLARMDPDLPSTGYGDLRRVALARLLVDNIGSIQVDWARHGSKLSQVALTFGADDVDAVSAVASSDQGWRRSPREEILRNIAAAGLTAIRRNGGFEEVADEG